MTIFSAIITTGVINLGSADHKEVHEWASWKSDLNFKTWRLMSFLIQDENNTFLLEWTFGHIDSFILFDLLKYIHCMEIILLCVHFIQCFKYSFNFLVRDFHQVLKEVSDTKEYLCTLSRNHSQNNSRNSSECLQCWVFQSWSLNCSRMAKMNHQKMEDLMLFRMKWNNLEKNQGKLPSKNLPLYLGMLVKL